MTTEPKWTPGPWKIVRSASYEDELVSETGATVAFAAWDGGSGCHLQIDNPADANLIAAAPSLYEALEEILAKDDIADDGGFLSTKHANLARAAVALARGESKL